MFTNDSMRSEVQIYSDLPHHYNDVTMDAIASQITSLTIVYSIVYSDADRRKYQSSSSLAFVRGIHRGPGTGEFPAQMASYAENVSIWWRHNVLLPNVVFKPLSSEYTMKSPSMAPFSWNVAIICIEPSYVDTSTTNQNTTAADIVMPWNPVYI